MVTRPVRTSDILDGHVSLDVECLDRIYLDGYVPNLQPAAEVARLDTSRLIPADPQHPQEPEPAQQIHPVRTLRRRRPATAASSAKNALAGSTTTPSPQPADTARTDPRSPPAPQPRDLQRGQVARHIPIADHENGT